ncbi:pleckstrin homology domain-containing family B member 1 isoform X2 [Theropithecus gelada]|nr:pleckstrin homology domain-containing family B member 1 isoform X2 [Theropithecus gelada]
MPRVSISHVTPPPWGWAGPEGGARGATGLPDAAGGEKCPWLSRAHKAQAQRVGWQQRRVAAGLAATSATGVDKIPPDSTLESPFEEMALVRGGWLWRQSSILRRWKRNWFALWLDGTLGYYHDETAQDEEDRVLIHFNVRDIKIGQECHDVQPPEGRSRDGLLTVNLREGGRLHLCAETRDDALAWKTALLEANSTPVRVYSPYQDYYEVVPPNAHEATYVRSYYGPPYAGPGVTHVIVREDPCYSTGAPLAMGMLAGAATGAALGSLMWSPCWF